MKKLVYLFLLTIPASPVLYGQQATHYGAYAKAGARHLFSTDGIKDIAAVYGIVVGMTLIHELGHAVVAKLKCGAPIDIVIGGERSGKDSLLRKYTGIEVAGFNPLKVGTDWEKYKSKDAKKAAEQEIIVGIAGPLAQAMTCYCIYRWLQNKDKFYLAKTTAIGGIGDTILGVNGILGALFLPWTDSARIVQNIKQYFSTKSHHTS
ncbi:MAG: hypothetical protein ACHQVS_03730 [Candidatus Babeliales bacterium]